MPTVGLDCAWLRALLGLLLYAVATVSVAASQILVDTRIKAVAVNGGQDSTNPGSTCLQVASALSAACADGYVAILNSNKQLDRHRASQHGIGVKGRPLLHRQQWFQPLPGIRFHTWGVISIPSSQMNANEAI